MGVPGAPLPHQPILAPCLRPYPGLGPIPNGPSPLAFAWPGLSVLPPAGGERQSLQQQQQLGLWVIAGFLTFLALEKMFLDSKEQEGTNQVSPKPQDLGTSVCSVVVPGPGGPGSELNPEKRVSWPFLGASGRLGQLVWGPGE